MTRTARTSSDAACPGSGTSQAYGGEPVAEAWG